MLVSILGVALSAQALHATPNRFDLTAPLPNLPAVRIDKIAAGIGVAQQMARANGWQARILWVDATANIDSYNTPEKIEALVDRAHRMGFNTISFDIKPIIGYTMYPSKLTEQITSWRGKTLPAGFDPVPLFIRACHSRGLKLFVCLNAFSEGHRLAREQKNNEFAGGKAGPGYEMEDLQSVQYRPVPLVRIGSWETEVAPILNSIGEAGAGLFDRQPPADTAVFLVDASRRLQRYQGRPVAAGERLLVLSGARRSSELRMGELVRIEAKPRFLKSSEDQNQIPLMMNPHDPRMVRRTIDFASEVLDRYPVDGLLYDDRLRFTGMDGDFSPGTRDQFEKLVGSKLNWPKDVFETTYNWDLGRGVRPGKCWDAWWAFRAKAMRDWVSAIRQRVDIHNRKSSSPAMLGIYAGSWYGEYDNYGANYASSELNAGFPFLTRAFRKQGFADLLDLFIAGCYYRVPTIFEAMVNGQPEGRTVEAASIMANRVINDDAWTVAGIALDVFFGDPSQVQGALQAATAASQGVMVFDNSHKIELFESTFQRAFSRPAVPPYARGEWLTKVRKTKQLRESQGAKAPPVFIYPGAPGAGH